jgi:2'-5' RNA ligase
MFFALWPDAPARSQIAELAGRVAEGSGGRAPPAANLHLTLAFVGEVAAERRDALLAAGREAVAGAAPFTIVLDRLGTFRVTGIAWIGTARAPDDLTGLAARLSHELAARGFPVERRPYAPHLTLARKCRMPLPPISGQRIEWEVRELALVRSVLRPAGSDYRIDARWTLRGPADGA